MVLKSRNINADLCKTISIIFVVMIHAIGFSPLLYSNVIKGADDFLFVLLIRILYSCVPLFVILSGYLNCNKILVLETYKNTYPRLLTTYFVWAIATAIFNVYVYDSNVKEQILGIFNFSGQGRAWYMNMYLGLVLLIPFINRALQDLDDRTIKCALILGFVCFFLSKWLMNIFDNKAPVLISTYWSQLYFVWYYVFGYYVKKHKESSLYIYIYIYIVILISVLTCHTLYYFVIGYGINYNDILAATGFFYDNPFLAIESGLLFLIIMNVNVRFKITKKVCECISKCSFDMYLASWMTDVLVYKYLFQNYYKSNMCLVLICNFLISFISVLVIAIVKQQLSKVIKVIIARRNE